MNGDSVVRTVYYKYLHPKEVLITNGVVNRDIPDIVKKISSKSKEFSNDDENDYGSVNTLRGGQKDVIGDNSKGGLDFVYPNGSTLNVKKPAFSILTSGFLSYPLNKPVVGIYKSG